MKKLLAIVLALATLLALPACTSAPVDKGNSITIATVSSTGGLDPAGFALDFWTEYSKLCIDGLVSFDDSGKMTYESAESHTVSEDGITWTFNLRKNAKWSDGSAVTAADFINTMMRALDPNNGNAIYSNMLYILKGAEDYNKGKGSADAVGLSAPDDYTLVLTLKQPCTYLLKMMSMPIFYPSKVGLATNENAAWYKDPATSLGNGAFCLESYTEGVGYTLVKNPHYYQADRVKLDKIETRFVTDATALLSSYKTGEVDVVTGLPAYVTEDYTEADGLYTWKMLTSKFILPNLSVKPLDDVRVREAIATALTRADICAVIGADYIPSLNYVAEFMISPSSEKLFKDEVDPLFAEDAARAKQLLADAGYPNGQGFPTLTYKYPNSEKDSLLAQGIQAQLKQVLGINVELVGMEDEVYAQDKKDGNYELIRHSWTADYNDPINFLNLYLSGASSNYNHVNDAKFDAAIAASDAATDPAERTKALHDAQKILVSDNFYVIPCVTQVYIGLGNPKIQGLSYCSTGERMYRFAYLTD